MKTPSRLCYAAAVAVLLRPIPMPAQDDPHQGPLRQGDLHQPDSLDLHDADRQALLNILSAVDTIHNANRTNSCFADFRPESSRRSDSSPARSRETARASAKGISNAQRPGSCPVTRRRRMSAAGRKAIAEASRKAGKTPSAPVVERKHKLSAAARNHPQISRTSRN